jgi:hypothetical protein
MFHWVVRRVGIVGIRNRCTFVSGVVYVVSRVEVRRRRRVVGIGVGSVGIDKGIRRMMRVVGMGVLVAS